MPFDFNQKNYRDLKELVLSSRRSNIVPFVGAGLSLYGPPNKRLPKWWELVSRIFERAKIEKLTTNEVTEIESLMKSELCIEALDKLYNYTTIEWVSQTVEQILEIEGDGISPAAISLMTISWTLIVTTNLDRMLELAHEELEIKERHTNAFPYHKERSLNVFTHRNEEAFLKAISIENAAHTSLAKIHGTVRDYQSFVLTTTAYNQLNQNGVYQYILNDLCRRTLLIIGFSLQDPDFDRAMDHIAFNFRAKNFPPYVILPSSTFRGDPNTPYRRRIEDLKENNQLRVITYQVDELCSEDDPWSGHKSLFECINDLSKAWLKNQKKIRIFGSLPFEEHFSCRYPELQEIDKRIFDIKKPCQIQGLGGEGKTALVSHWLTSRKDRLSENGIKNVFIFNCYVDSPTSFFSSASQTLTGLRPGMALGEQRNSILSFAKANKTLFVFDQFEIFQEQKKGGIRDRQFFSSFLQELIYLGSPIILTTRLVIPEFYKALFLKPLKSKEIDELVDAYLPNGIHPVTLKTALDHLKGHAQSIALFLGNPQTYGKTYSTSFIPHQYQSEPPTDNKAIYTLKTIRSGLSKNEDIILQVACIFRFPFTIDIIRKLLAENLDQLSDWTNPNQDENELRKCVSGLVDKQLIISNDGPATYYLHPNVRDYYKSIERNQREIHAAYVDILDKKRHNEKRDGSELTFSPSQANEYFSLAYHSAKAGKWSLFDYYYQNILMQGQKDYVCDTLGMWSEILDLTRCIFPNGHPNSLAKMHSAYYSSRYARSLKHLGYGAEAADAYDYCLCFCAEELFPKTTIYVNNYLTLEIYRGNLKKAANMVSWNFATMQWIDTENGKCNQIEHGGYSIGWLAMLMGDFVTAQSLFNLAQQAWKGREQERDVFFDYYPVYFAELYLIEDGNNVRSQGILDSYLELAEEFDWKETEARCYIFQSMLHRHAAKKRKNKKASLHAAASFCNSAETVINKIFAPPVEMELVHELLCVYFEAPLEPNLKQQDSQLMKRFMDLRTNLGWDIYHSDEIAFKGLESELRGKTKRAQDLLAEAEVIALSQGNKLSLLSPYRPITMLRERLGLVANLSFSKLSNSKSNFTITQFDTISSDKFKAAVKDSFLTQPLKLK